MKFIEEQGMHNFFSNKSITFASGSPGTGSLSPLQLHVTQTYNTETYAKKKNNCWNDTSQDNLKN